MGINYTMPKLAMAMNEGSINEWLVKHGDKVEKGQKLMSVETEKVSYECESPAEGYLCIVVQEGITVPCDSVVGHFCASLEEVEALSASAGVDGGSARVKEPVLAEPAATTPPANESTVATITPIRAVGERIKASPLARKIARDNQLDLTLVAGTGPGGRIIKCDIEEALERSTQPPVTALAQGGSLEKARIPLKGMRKVIADRMHTSLQTTAQLSSNWESDITDLLIVRNKFVDRQKDLGTKVSVNAFIVKAICYAIKQVPIANSCRSGDDIVIYENINMGIAVSIPGVTDFDRGLMVAVLHNVERMGLVEIDQEMKSLINRVRNGEASSEDLTGSTITLSSTAGFAPPGLKSTPVLNLPNAALVGPSTPVEKPVVHNGEIVPRTVMPMSFTFDHCLLDGEPAARFMSALHDALENPELMLA
jgi:pyruvate dehydrogenase E2 component (dihydrolipoyllysine-residue acetyltransferase)